MFRSRPLPQLTLLRPPLLPVLRPLLLLPVLLPLLLLLLLLLEVVLLLPRTLARKERSTEGEMAGGCRWLRPPPQHRWR